MNDENDESSGCSGYSEETFAFEFCTSVILDKVNKKDKFITIEEAVKFFTATGGNLLDDWLLLDSEATEHIIKNKHMVKNIRKAKRGCKIYGSTGNKVAPNIATMVGVGNVLFDEDSPANVLSLAKMGEHNTLHSTVGAVIYYHYTNPMDAQLSSNSTHVDCTTMKPRLEVNYPRMIGPKLGRLTERT